MQARDEKLQAIINWAQENEDIRAALLTSSLVNPLARVDDFSDLDIELVFTDINLYVSNNQWLSLFGTPISSVEEDETYFDGKHAMKMVLYDDHVKVDFKLYKRSTFLEDIQADELHEDWDVGYKVLLDKDSLTRELKPPTRQSVIIKKPTEKKYNQVMNDFWWDTTYVAKCLARDEIFYAKFMSESILRIDYLVQILEWHIASEHNWNITTNKYGRYFKRYLSADQWQQVERTFSGSRLEDNWNALFAFADVVHYYGTRLAEKLGYTYPLAHELNVRKYLEHTRSLSSVKAARSAE